MKNEFYDYVSEQVGYQTFEEIEYNMEDLLLDFVDNEVYIYWSDLMEWLTDTPDSDYYMGMAIREGFTSVINYNLEDHIRAAQALQINEDNNPDFYEWLQYYAQDLPTIATWSSGFYTIQILQIEGSEVVFLDGTNNAYYAEIEDDEDEPYFMDGSLKVYLSDCVRV